VTKNKVAPPFREAEFDIMYNEGISKVGELVDMGVALEIITKRGAFFAYNDTRLGQGRENAKTYLKENPDMADEIELAIRAQSLNHNAPLPLAREEDAEAGDEKEEVAKETEVEAEEV